MKKEREEPTEEEVKEFTKFLEEQEERKERRRRENARSKAIADAEGLKHVKELLQKYFR